MGVVRVINLGGVKRSGRVINLREVCPEWDGRVSEKARAEIEASERRAALVIQTANRFWFR